MDPNANLAEQRRLAAEIIRRAGDETECNLPVDFARLDELVQALDEWITKGGFLPTSWGARS